MVFLSLPLYKGQTITTLAENGRKGFALYAPWYSRQPSRLRLFFRPLFLMKAKKVRLTKVSHDELWKLGSEGRLWATRKQLTGSEGQLWPKKGRKNFRALCAMAIKVAR